MGYIQKSLGKNEEIKYEFKLNKYTLMTPFLFFAFAFGMLIFGTMVGDTIPWQVYILVAATSFVSGLIMFIKLKSLEYGVTNNRIISKSGFIARNTEEVLNKAVETIEVKQDILGRIFGYGDVVVTGRGNSVVVFRGIDDPLQVKREIEEVVFD